MIFISFDYGRKKVGVALSLGSLAEPLKVLKGENYAALLKQALTVIDNERPDELVVGLSENEIASEAKRFGEELSLVTRIPVVFVDETLSTHDAQEMAIHSNMKRKKRKEMEDAFAAAVILQKYLDK